MQAINRFVGGIDTDSNLKSIPNDRIRDAWNISLFEDENFSASRAMLGQLYSVGNSGGVISAIASYGTIEGKKEYGVISFNRDGTIKFYVPDQNAFYTLYSGLSFGKNVSAVAYSDRNKHEVYWADGVNPLRVLEVNNRVRVPSDKLLSLRPLNPIDILKYKRVEDDGQLYAGSIIVFYRYYNSERCVYSALSNPSPVIPIAESGRGGIIGEPVNKRVILGIDTDLGKEGYDAVQLLVVKNYDGSKTTQTKGYLTEPRKEWYEGNEIAYTGEGKEITVDLADFMIDDLALITASTIDIEGNRIVYGNFTLNGFEGAPVTESVSLKEVILDDYSDPDNVVNYTGHWRDELYVYGYQYSDEFGNSAVFPIDMSGYEGNKSTSWGWKYPNREESPILNEENKIRALGLNLKFTNHPTWAKNVQIVRRKRIKDILWQTPHIPTIAVQGVPTSFVWKEHTRKGGDKEKRVYVDYSGDLDYAIPKIHNMGIARNLINIRDEVYDFGGLKMIFYPEWISQGRPEIEGEGSRMIYAVPPEYMYGVEGESYELKNSGGYDVRIVDGVVLRRRGKSFYNSKYIDEEDIRDGDDRSIKAFVFQGKFASQYANDGNYRFSDDEYRESDEEKIRRLTTRITYQIGVPTAESGLTLKESPFVSERLSTVKLWGFINQLAKQQFEHESLVEGLIDFFSPACKNQRGLLLMLSEPLYDMTHVAWERRNTKMYDDRGIDFYTSVTNDSIVTGGVENYHRSDGKTTIKATYNDDDTSSVACASYILNSQKGLGDDRYGSLNSGGEWISTGKGAVINRVDEVIEFDVFGGDCYIGMHSFKVHESTPKPINYQPAIDFLGNQYKPGFDTEGVANEVIYHLIFDLYEYYGKVGTYKRNIEILDVWLESEVNPYYANLEGRYPSIETTDTLGFIEDGYQEFGGGVSDKQFGYFDGDWDYYYQPQYSAPNDVKIYVGKDDLCDANIHYPYGYGYSDIRVRGGVDSAFVDVNGFDRFKVNNFKVLDAQKGPILKIMTLGDRGIYIFQERGIAYQSVGIELVQDADGVVIATGTGNVFGRDVLYVPGDVGSQDFESIKKYRGYIYGCDGLQKKVYRFGSRFSNYESISDKWNDSYFEKFFNGDIRAYIDTIYERYVILNDIEGKVFNTKSDSWETRITHCDYGIGIEGLVIQEKESVFWKSYHGDRGIYFGVQDECYVEIVLNDAENFSKVYSVIHLNSLGKGDELEVSLTHESSNHFTGRLKFDYHHKNHQSYKNTLRDITHHTRSKIRGEAAILRVYYSENYDTIIHSVFTDYRYSS